MIRFTPSSFRGWESAPANAQSAVMPGYRLTFGITVFYLGVMVILPLSLVFVRAFTLEPAKILGVITAPRVIAAFKLSFGTAFAAAATNVLVGFLIAWTLVRCSFPGKRLIDGLVDLPFALPTAVAGIALTTLYEPRGWFGSLLAPFGIKVAFSELGIFLALSFVGLPFVIRTVQSVLQDLDPDLEGAAASMGASPARSFFKIILPVLYPSLFTGFGLAFARALGEYGSVVFISGNLPMRTEIMPLLIMARLEQFDYAGASALAAVMLVVSFSVMLAINFIQLGFAAHGSEGR